MIGAKQRPSFTLIELLIVAAIFSFAALLATTVFSNIQTTQRTILGQQRVTTDGRYILETLARGVRTGQVNYGVWVNGVVPASPTIFSVVDQDNVVTCYQKSGSQLQVLTPAPSDCSGTWVSITPDDLQVDSFSFFISPTSDPFRAAPRITTDCKPVVPLSSAHFDENTGTCTCEAETDCFSNFCSDTGSGTRICTNPNVQPQVTFVLTTSSKQSQGGVAKSTLQTTVVSRIYQR